MGHSPFRSIIAALLVFSLGHGAASLAATVSTDCETYLASQGATQALAVFDPMSSGAQIAARIRRRPFAGVQYRPVAVLSQPREKFTPELFSSVHLEDFDPADVVYFDGDLDKLQLELTARGVVDGFIGTETSVDLHAQMAQRMGFGGNAPELTPVLRHKFLQGEHLRRRGIPVAEQILTGSFQELMAFALTVGWPEKPLVIKPPDGAGGFLVTIDTDLQVLEAGFRAILADKNPLNSEPFTQVLGMRYLPNQEGVADFVSMWDSLNDEIHIYATDYTFYKKTRFNGFTIYDEEEIMPFERAVEIGMEQYGMNVVRALPLRNGASHHEIKGNSLVETNGRLSGGGFPKFVEDVTGVNPIDVMIEAARDPQAFLARFSVPKTVRPNRIVYLRTLKSGTLVDLPHMDQIRKLPSFRGAKMVYATEAEAKQAAAHGHAIRPTMLVPTTNFLNYPGHIELVNDDRAQLEQDVKTVLELRDLPTFYTVK